ncbi:MULTISPECIES: pyridoxamine 5'-phosphate oxidase family protein [Gordonia]|uniref:pyridoxamine 5'-phosphate oxidase family protein n=1 Tax=Gordonia TaxID=2053 RepID=UPI0009FADA95
MDNGIAELLNRDRDTLARLTTVDTDGYPHVTPIGFLWTSGRFHLTSRPHLARIRANPRGRAGCRHRRRLTTRRRTTQQASTRLRAIGVFNRHPAEGIPLRPNRSG